MSWYMLAIPALMAVCFIFGHTLHAVFERKDDATSDEMFSLNAFGLAALFLAAMIVVGLWE